MADTVCSDRRARMRKLSKTRVIPDFRRKIGDNRQQAAHNLFPLPERQPGSGGNDLTATRQRIMLRLLVAGHRSRCQSAVASEELDPAGLIGSENAFLPESPAVPDRSRGDKKCRRQVPASELRQGAVARVGSAVVKCDQEWAARQRALTFSRRQRVGERDHAIRYS